ncbi:MAG: hypothetical protein ABEH88_00755 [Halobacteriales archaeon]
MRCWLVEREFDDKGMVRLVYATPDGSRHLLRERSAAQLGRYDVTAATDIDEERLTPVEDTNRRERYASEAERMANRHDPGDTV